MAAPAGCDAVDGLSRESFVIVASMPKLSTEEDFSGDVAAVLLVTPAADNVLRRLRVGNGASGESTTEVFIAFGSTQSALFRSGNRVFVKTGRVRIPHLRPVKRRTAAAIALCLLVAASGPEARGSPPAAPGAGPLPRAAVGPAWLWPVVGHRQILRPFVAPADRYSAGHRGLDVFGVPGSVVLAPADGIVYFAGKVVDRPVLTLEHPDEVLASFEPVEALVGPAASSTAGEQIGVVGTGGHCSEVCVHVGMRLRGEYVSPLLFLGGAIRAVLLPLE